jgi:hypothetical protein
MIEWSRNRKTRDERERGSVGWFDKYQPIVHTYLINVPVLALPPQRAGIVLVIIIYTSD